MAQPSRQPCRLCDGQARLTAPLAKRRRTEHAAIESAIDATPDSTGNALSERRQDFASDAQQALRTRLPSYEGPRADPKLLRMLQRRGYIPEAAYASHVRIPPFPLSTFLHAEE